MHLSTASLQAFIDKIKYHRTKLELFQTYGLTLDGHTFTSIDYTHTINHMRHSGGYVVFEFIPNDNPSVFDENIRFSLDGTSVQYTISFGGTYGIGDEYRWKPTESWTFPLCSTEEELFQQSTLHDMKELTIEIMHELKKLYDDQNELCNAMPKMNTK